MERAGRLPVSSRLLQPPSASPIGREDSGGDAAEEDRGADGRPWHPLHGAEHEGGRLVSLGRTLRARGVPVRDGRVFGEEPVELLMPD